MHQWKLRVSKMCQDVVICLAHVMLSFHAEKRRMILKFILTFPCTSVMCNVVMVGGMMEYDIAQARVVLSVRIAMMHNDE